jgi:AcrR family transcriptional regulator
MPRRPDPATRLRLIDAGARLLAAEGPTALTTRRVAAEVGCSTMSVYTYFGGMGGLVRAIVHEGFARLHVHLTGVAHTEDPVADMALLGRAYRLSALTSPHLYAVMFGASSLGGFALTEEDRQHGRYTMAAVVECVARCIAAGRFAPGDAELVVHQMWLGAHGLVSLELGGYLVEPWDGDRLFEAQLIALMVGAGDDPAAAAGSVAASRARFADGPGGGDRASEVDELDGHGRGVAHVESLGLADVALDGQHVDAARGVREDRRLPRAAADRGPDPR